MSQVPADSKIVFIGGGNMGQALAGGLLNSGWPAENVTIVDTDPDMSARLKSQFKQCHIFSRTETALASVDIVVLAVKPQAMRLACEQIVAQCQSTRPLVISIAAGTSTKDVDTWLGGGLAVVRCMPNTPALVQAGTTGMYANSEVSLQQREIAEAVLGSVGFALWLQQESLLDVVTAVSGSGPAYFFYLIEAMLDAGQSLGLNEMQARQLVVHTAAGAAQLIEKTGETPQQLRLAVTSKGGTTEAAIKTLDQGNVKNIIRAAITNAAEKAQQLASATNSKTEQI